MAKAQSVFDYKAIQYDVSRGRIPRLETVKRRLDLLRPHGLNAVFLYMESVVECEAFPAVGCGHTPITKDYLAELNRLCCERGMLLIPILQVFGHQGKLLSLPDYQHLGELARPDNKYSAMNNFLPGNTEAAQRVAVWIEELLPFFDSPFFHVGCDEAYTLGTGCSRKLVEEKGVARVVADYLATINQLLRKHGRQMMLWGDFIIHYPELLEMLPRDCALANWGYGSLDEQYEVDNHHFAGHAHLASKGHQLWLFGNNMAEYIMTPFQRLEENLRIWLDLGRTHGAKGFVISDWGSYENINPFVLSLLGDLYSLMRINDESMDLDTFLAEFSRIIVGRPDNAFIKAARLMITAQCDPDIFDKRLLRWYPQFPSLLLDDPQSACGSAKRFGCYRKECLELLHERMIQAESLLGKVDASGAAQPDYLDDLLKLANRLVAMSLRALLWHELAWDSGYIYPNPARDRKLDRLKKEYQTRADVDIEWHGKKWRADNLESEYAKSHALLIAARDFALALFPNI